ncbi:uncharacterized protein LOC121731968 [Aricia agestis]|uniref:uncharacterized protein LOC121731968 n=1 Tax=Aricia agestis TaxID=91739 RepID=UPI001C20A44A|nr:uncharacterized protein LOC121731968 [Aricia agestis]
MSVSSAMFLFEVVVESVDSLVQSQQFVIRSDFADIFSLELKDPKQLHIPMPEPLPLPSEPPGKKGKKKKKAKPKKRGKKGKKDKEVEPPPGPVIQSGQSVLFSSTAEFLIQTMKKFPLELALWSKEDRFTHIGSALIPWDLNFFSYLQKIFECGEVPPPVKINETYNIFEEGTAKLMARVGIQIKLTYLADKITTAFRTLSEDPAMMRILYTGLNSKTTSFICNMKNRDEEKIDHTYVKDVSKPDKIEFASYKNAPSANLTNFKDENYCCMNDADKPSSTDYKVSELAPDIDFIIDYVRKIIVSCNNNMRMLTPRPVLKPRAKATDLDKLCYCRELNWPEGETAARFRDEIQSSPCAVCANAAEDLEKARRNTIDLTNIRGPCGRTDCRIARYMKSYIQDLIEEDNQEININDVVGPCGSKECTLADKIKQILRHEGLFKKGATKEGLSTQCACIDRLQNALSQGSCLASCPKECEETDSYCQGNICPYKEPIQNVYNVYYFTVEYDFDANSSGNSTSQSSKYKYCSSACPSLKESKVSKSFCSKSICSTTYTDKTKEIECQDSRYTSLNITPADSNVEIPLDEILNPCKLESCIIADKIKDIIVDGAINKKIKTTDTEHCFCECVCDLNFSRQTTYCSVCGGYECLGDDTKDMPDFLRPQPCPIFHKTYNKDLFKVKSPWPEKPDKEKIQEDTRSLPSYPRREISEKKLPIRLAGTRDIPDSKSEKGNNDKPPKPKKPARIRKPVGKFTANVKSPPYKIVAEPKPKKNKYYRYPPVPKDMGWKWDAKSILGLEPRPQWKPGAAKKTLVRRYRAVREGVDKTAKKKRAMMQKKKKLEMKPTLVVTKKNGEYTVQMEIFKVFSKERLPYQYPYDEKLPLVYTIGKTEEEKRKSEKRQERKERRATRRRLRFVQSTFRDKCQEICLKTYNQAIGVLPKPNESDLECPCQIPAVQDIQSVGSCSCSDGESVLSSDTDDDEWVIEFTPPAARFDPKFKHKPVYVDSNTQYTYLDYRVKIFDKAGNPVPRFFKGPDGKQECSDLGGFWGLGHVWLEINRDGYIGPDNRWVPNNFTGPDGMSYSAQDGTVTDNTGRFLKIGIDGYIDKDGKWAWYSRARQLKGSHSGPLSNKNHNLKAYVSNKRDKEKQNKKTTSAKDAIVSKDKRPFPKGLLNAKPSDHTQKSKKSVTYSIGNRKSPIVMTASVNFNRAKLAHSNKKEDVSDKAANKYNQIMKELKLYDETIFDYNSKPLVPINKASNTPMKNRFKYKNIMS